MATVDTTGRFGAEVVIDGLEQTRNNLERIGPALRRDLDRRLKNIGNTVAETARREVLAAASDRRGSIFSQASEVAAGYKVKRRGAMVSIVNTTKPGAIEEFAATGRSPQGKALVSALDDKFGEPGRLLWDAYDLLAPWIIDEITDVVDDAEARLRAGGL